MLKHIYAVVGYGLSDIGKGWLTASIASVLPHALAVKIDPFLNRSFPSELGVIVDGVIVSEDLAIYRELGIPVYPECNITNGHLLFEFLQISERVSSSSQGTKKLTMGDLSDFLACKILDATKKLVGCENLVLEIGGTIADLESCYIPLALMALKLRTGILPEIVVLTFLEQSETTMRAKTRFVSHAIEEVRSKYSLPIKACFVRNRYVLDEFTPMQIEHVSQETKMSSARIFFEPNFDNVHQLREMISEIGIFGAKPRYLVSACLLGIPCRYNGTASALDEEVMKLLSSGEVIAICPELLADLPIPRGPFEIVGGSGQDVLDGTAKVLSYSGEDYTDSFVAGAHRSLGIVRNLKPTEVVLFNTSPSCGCGQVFDGSFGRKLISGDGVFAALLKQEGISVVPNGKLR